MNFLPRMLTGIVLGSFGLSLLMAGSTATAADALQWRSSDQKAARRLAPPQNGRISAIRSTKTSTQDEATTENQGETRQVSHTQIVKKTVTTRPATKRKATRAPAKLAKAVAAKPVKPRLSKTAARKASATKQAAYTPSIRKIAPWQQQKNAKFGLQGNRVARRPARTASGYKTVSAGSEVILEPEEIENLGDAFSSTCSDGSCGSSCGGSCGDSCGGSCGNCDGVTSTCGDGSCNWDTSCCLPFGLPSIDNVTFFSGVEGFKGPVDFGANGNFGFGIGMNISGPLRSCDKIGYQVGVRYVGSNFNGYRVGGIFDDDTRSQTFITGGVFRRASSCCPWQWGVAYDYLYDEYHYEANLSQVRMELSRIGCFGNELGVLVMQRSSKDTNVTSSAFTGTTLDLEAYTQYLFFVRRRFDSCGEGRLWGGVSGHGDGIVGADLRIPITGSVAATGGFNYMFSDKSSATTAQQEDSFGIGLNLVWHPRCKARDAGSNPLRALFDVANNQTFMVRNR